MDENTVMNQRGDGTENNPYSVTELTSEIITLFENSPLSRLTCVKGEVTGLKFPVDLSRDSNGHTYFSLKDDNAVIKCNFFIPQKKAYLSRYREQAFTLESGQEIIVVGELSCYPKGGYYNIKTIKVINVGEGDINAAYEQLKAKLEGQGLFDPKYKRMPPAYCKKIGIVTSSTGSAIEDIEKNARKLNPFVQLYLYPSLVQGDRAAASMIAGIEYLDKMGLDVIIIGRGGGSTEELWPFNDEGLAWAIFNAATPIISGTGHEDYWTIADYVADVRESTPTAAIVRAVPDVMSVIRQNEGYRNRLMLAMKNKLEKNKDKLKVYENQLESMSPSRNLEKQKLYLSNLNERFLQAMNRKYTGKKHRYELLLGKLNGLSPTAKLVGGYGYIEDEKGKSVTSVHDVKENEEIRITVHDGQIKAAVTGIEED